MTAHKNKKNGGEGMYFMGKRGGGGERVGKGRRKGEEEGCTGPRGRRGRMGGSGKGREEER